MTVAAARCTNVVKSVSARFEASLVRRMVRLKYALASTSRGAMVRHTTVSDVLNVIMTLPITPTVSTAMK